MTEEFKKELGRNMWILLIVGAIAVVLFLSAAVFLLNL